MRAAPFFFLLLLPFAARAEKDYYYLCHVKMDSGERYNVTLPESGGELQTPLGTLGFSHDRNGIYVDKNAVEITSGTGRPSWTGNVSIRRQGAEQEATQSFVPLLVTELYLQKGDAKGVLTCGSSDDQKVVTAGIQPTDRMPDLFETGKRASLRMQNYYMNPALSQAPGLDTAKLIARREKNWIDRARPAIKKIDLADENKGLQTVVAAQLNPYLNNQADYSVGGPKIGSFPKEDVKALAVQTNRLVLLSRTNGNIRELVPYKAPYGMESVMEGLDEQDFVLPGYQLLEKKSEQDRTLDVRLQPDGSVKRIPTEQTSYKGRVLIWGAEQLVPKSKGDAQIDLPLMDASGALNSLNQELENMGKPLAEIPLRDARKAKRVVKMSESEQSGILGDHLAVVLKSGKLSASDADSALAASGLEKNLAATDLGLARLLIAQGIRATTGTLPKADPRIDAILNQRLQAKLRALKDPNQRLLMKLALADPEQLRKKLLELLGVDPASNDLSALVANLMKLAQSGKAEEANRVRIFAKWLNVQKIDMKSIHARIMAQAKSNGNGEKVDAGQIQAASQIMMTLLFTVDAASSGIKEDDYKILNDQLSRFLIAAHEKMKIAKVDAEQPLVVETGSVQSVN